MEVVVLLGISRIGERLWKMIGRNMRERMEGVPWRCLVVTQVLVNHKTIYDHNTWPGRF